MLTYIFIIYRHEIASEKKNVCTLVLPYVKKKTLNKSCVLVKVLLPYIIVRS